MSVFYSILGILALGLFSAVLLPIFVVVFVVRIAGVVVSVSKAEAKEIEIELAAPLSAFA
jgi:hypothetical protein